VGTTKPVPTSRGSAVGPYLGLFGGGVFPYFSSLIIFSRVFVKRVGRKVGSQGSERAAYVLGGLWALSAVTMIGLAVVRLSQ
jgi:hypothetical protein